MATVLITGGTGLVGIHLSKRLQEKGFTVTILSRRKISDSKIKTYYWDYIKNKIDKEAIDKADYIIHLSGASILNKKWTPKRKQLIIDSRVRTSQLIFNNIKKQNKNLKAFISASAIGYYGMVTSENIYKETDPSSNDFIGNTCKQCEQSADKFNKLGIRTLKIRIGVVLTKEEGALSKMAKPVKIGVGAALGTGKQYIPWIHIDDLCNIFINVIENENMEGCYNAVAPDHKTNKEFTRVLARILKKTILLPNIPSFIIKILFGERAQLILEGSRVSSEKIKAAGFKFLYPKLEEALTNLI